MLFAGIDIGSTCTKSIVMNDQAQIVYRNLQPTGWDSVGTAVQEKQALDALLAKGEKMVYVATGYGRVAVPYADKTVTEITCHAKGAGYLFGTEASLVIDIGGQDTKIIALQDGRVKDFIMNDKCSAGTGRFLEIMAASLGVTLDGLCGLAQRGQGVTISSMCTVFAESEVISLIGRGTPKEDIAFGVIESITSKVKQQASRLLGTNQQVFLTGGLCELDYVVHTLAQKLGCEITSSPLGRFAGAIGAALLAKSTVSHD